VDKPSVVVLLSALLAGLAVGGENFSATLTEPAEDRWMYPANGTPGSRTQASTFSALPGDLETDNRFGQFVFKFDTAAAGIPAGLGVENYQISAITLTATIGLDRLFQYDPTQDAWFTYGMTELPDTDPGRPLELHGTGFRNSFTAASFQENSPHYGGSPTKRNAFALGFDESGVPRDVTDNVTEAFESFPWAIGQIEGLTPGAAVPVDSIVRFTPNLNQPGVAAYLREGLHQGFIWFTLSSLHPAIQQGGEFVSYYTRDNPVHQLFGDAAPSLTVSYKLPTGFTSFSRNEAGLVTLDFIGLGGFTHILQASTDLAEDSWQNLQTFPAAPTTLLTWQEASPQPRRFFRIARLPTSP
jgi:hypothetical protein